MEVAKLIILLIGLSFWSCSSDDEGKTSLMVFHAGSLSIPMKMIEQEYEQLHPEIDIVRESSGSRKTARKISDLHRDCDLFLSADYRVIDNLLIPDYTDHLISFAGNEMVLAYNEKSRRKDEITQHNWYNILQQDDIGFGRTDPELDPCGYRTVLLFQLSNLYYQDSLIATALEGKDKKYIRGSEAELSALLESGELDYLFIYKSVAEQHGLGYLQFSDSINLSIPELNEFYSNAKIELGGKTSDASIVHVGASITYGLCIPKASKKKDAALDFTKFILDKEKGMKILEQQGQNRLELEIMATERAVQDSLKQRLF